MRGRSWTYPNRVRCLVCRNFFGFAVFEDLFCSEECAGLPKYNSPETVRAAPIPFSLDWKLLPRKCRNDERRKWRPKSRYWTQVDAELVAYRQSPWKIVREPTNGPVRLYYRPDRPVERRGGLDVYLCTNCGFYHIGHNWTGREFE